jgi:predicted dehydrogenase
MRLVDEGYRVIGELVAGTEARSFEIVGTGRLELEAFADGILGGSPNPVSAAEALHGTAVLDAILESAANGGTLVAVQRPSAELAFGPLSFPESRAK